MGRGPRIQFAGAHYHVINRGNYRQNIFGTPGAANAFESCLFETCEEMGWALHAHVIMRNHFHLALETPRANLAKGMQMLEGTFAQRFNRYRKEHGHLFQGRYKSPLVEPGPSLLRVVNYIHLNPVRAGVTTVDELTGFRWGSFHWFAAKQWPHFMKPDRWLHELGLEPTLEGWAQYADFLRAKSLDPEGMKLPRGWAIGSADWRRTIARDHRDRLRLPHPAGAEWRSLVEAQWGEALEQLLHGASKTLEEAVRDRRGAPWKIQMAHHLRCSTTATIAWIAKALHMGSPNSLKVYLSRLRKINL